MNILAIMNLIVIFWFFIFIPFIGYMYFSSQEYEQAESLADSEHKIIHAIGHDFFDGYSAHERRPVDFSSEPYAKEYESEVVTVKTISIDEHHKVKVAKISIYKSGGSSPVYEKEITITKPATPIDKDTMQ